MKAKYFLIIGLGIIFLGLFFQREIASHTKALLLISQEFPQIPVKPLNWMTGEPKQQTVEIGSMHGKVVANLFVPAKNDKPKPAVIFAMGVRTQEKDKPILLGFANTMSRLGYVVLWPTLEVLDKGTPVFEQPETFIQAFKYLESLEFVDPNRISLIGFSIGSSTAIVASQNPQIAKDVHALVFFGGYFDVFDYLVSLSTQTATYDNELVKWEPVDGATQHAKDIFTQTNATSLLKIFETESEEEVKLLLSQASEDEISQLKRLNPSQNIEDFKARIFILHDKKDSYVPYFESLKLERGLSKDIIRTLLITNLFEHVQPEKGVSWKVVVELLKLYRFLYETLGYL